MAIDPRVDIGHVHLKVSDLQRAIAFYRDVLGFELHAALGDQAAFISAGGYHHHLGLNTWESKGGSPPPPRHDGSLSRCDPVSGPQTLAQAVRRVLDAGIRLDGASDHGVSEAIYLRDPTRTASSSTATARGRSGRCEDGDGVAIITAPLELDGAAGRSE